MINGRIISVDQNVCIIPQARCTGNMLERMRGMLGRPPLTASEALLIRPCSSVHMFGMRYALDLVYLRHDWTISKLIHALQPWRVSACPGAAMVIEMNAGRVAELGLITGQRLRWESE